MAPGQRRTFTGVETVESKLDGTLVVIEGVHKGKVAGSDEEVVVHHAFGVISYDAQAASYRFRSYLASGLSVDADARVVDEKTFVWGYKDPRGWTVGSPSRTQRRTVGSKSANRRRTARRGRSSSRCRSNAWRNRQRMTGDQWPPVIL